MFLVAKVASWSIFAFGALLFTVQLIAHEIGRWLGRRHVVRNRVSTEGIGVLVGGMLGLLAFVLALTLSFSADRFYERRQGTLAEANAIGAAWLRRGDRSAAGRCDRAAAGGIYAAAHGIRRRLT